MEKNPIQPESVMKGEAQPGIRDLTCDTELGVLVQVPFDNSAGCNSLEGKGFCNPGTYSWACYSKNACK